MDSLESVKRKKYIFYCRIALYPLKSLQLPISIMGNKSFLTTISPN